MTTYIDISHLTKGELLCLRRQVDTQHHIALEKHLFGLKSDVLELKHNVLKFIKRFRPDVKRNDDVRRNDPILILIARFLEMSVGSIYSDIFIEVVNVKPTCHWVIERHAEIETVSVVEGIKEQPIPPRPPNLMRELFRIFKEKRLVRDRKKIRDHMSTTPGPYSITGDDIVFLSSRHHQENTYFERLPRDIIGIILKLEY